ILPLPSIMRRAIASVPALPTDKHTTLGGAPCRKLSCRKSSSFDTITKSWSRAYVHTSASDFPCRPSVSTCALLGKSRASCWTNRELRFSSNSSFTPLLDQRGAVHARPRSSGATGARRACDRTERTCRTHPFRGGLVRVRSGPPLPPELRLPVDGPAGFRGEVHGADLSEVLRLRRHKDSGDGVRKVVVAAGPMVDRIAPAPRGSSLEAAELGHQPRVIEEFDSSGVHRREKSSVQLALRLLGHLVRARV